MVSIEPVRRARVLPAGPTLITVTPSTVETKSTPKLREIPIAVPPTRTVEADRIELSAIPSKASLEGMVVAVARVIGPDGNPVLDGEVEWTIDRTGVGVVVAAGGRDEPDARNFRRSATLARCRTSANRYSLSRYVRTDEPITIHPGESWCVVQSYAAGDMILTARSADIVSADHCQATHRMHWYEAKLEVYPVSPPAAGEPATIVARVVNETGQALAGYPVRFEVLDSKEARLSADQSTEEVASDSAGEAKVTLDPHADRSAACRVRVQLLGRALIPGPPTLLDDQVVDVRWSDVASPLLAVNAPAKAAVGSQVRIESRLVEAPSSIADGSRLLAVVGAGVSVLSALPEPGDEAGVRFALASGTAGDPLGTEELVITSDVPGDRRVRVELHDGERVLAAREVTVHFVEPTLRVEKSMPDTWRVGESSLYRIVVENVGEVAATDVVVEDEVPAGLRVDQTDGVRFIDRIRWKLAEIAPGQKSSFVVMATPEQTFEHLSVRAWAKEPRMPDVEAFGELHVAGMETVEVAIEDVADPTPIAGRAEYVIRLVNRGSATARQISLEASLSPHLKVISVEGSLAGRVQNGVLELGPVAELRPGESVVCRLKADATKVGDARLAIAVQHAALGPSGLLQQESTRIYQP